MRKDPRSGAAYRAAAQAAVTLFGILLFLLPLGLFPQEADGEEAELSGEPSETYELPPVTVTGDAGEETPNPARPVSTPYGTGFNVVTEERIKEQGSADILDALRDVPGVIGGKHNLAGTTTGPSLYIRGRGYSHPSLETGAYFDGVPRFGLVYGQSMADGLPVSAAERLEVYKYPQPSRFGAGYALVNVVPKYQSEQGWSAESGFSGGSYYTFNESLGAGFRRRRFDLYASQSWVSTGGHVVHSGARQQSYYLNGGLWINPYWDLRLLFNYTDAETQGPPYRGQSVLDILPAYKTDTLFGTFTVNNHFDRAEGYLKVYINDTDFRWLDEEPAIPGDWSLQDITAAGGRVRETLWLWEGGEIITGLDLDRTRTLNEDHNTTTPTVITRFPRMILLSPYLAASHYIGLFKDKFRIIPSAGLRGYVHTIWDNALAPQAGLILGYGNTELALSYALGIIYPAPAIIQDLLNANPSYNTGSLKKIRPEKVRHYEGGITHNWPEKNGLAGALGASWFFDDGRDRVVTVQAVPGNAGSLSRFRLQGLELSGSLGFEGARPLLEKITLFAGGSWIIRVRAAGEDGREASRMPFTPRWSMSGGLTWNFLKRFRLSGDYQFLYDLYGGSLMPSGSFSPPAETDKLADIHLLNLRLSWSFEYAPWRLEKGELFVSVNNLLNRTYEYYRGYEMPGVTWMLGGSLKFK
jgi:iron complex outermembrane receptor protein